MKSGTIRVIIIASLLTCAGIILTQMFWVRKAYDLQQKNFDLKANSALAEVSNAIYRYQNTEPGRYSAVEQISGSYFVVRANAFVEKAVLQHFLATAFTRQTMLSDFEYGFYDCAADTVQYQGYYHMPNSNESAGAPSAFPRLKREGFYFGVIFPHRRHFLNTQLNLWTVSSFVLLCVVGFLGYLLFVIFKQKRLAEIQKDFVNNMTHEFRTPLSAIQLSANVLKNPDIVSQPQRLLNYATIISNESAQLTTHVDRVLQMTQVEQRRMELNRKSFVWQDMLRETAESFSQLALAKDSDIHLHLPAQPIDGFGDVLHLKNTLGNLLENAVKYNEQRPEINITLRTTKQHALIQVSDNGIGIDAAHQKLLFQKFYRVPTGNVHNVKGFGLGLNYVHLIMNAHSGAVSCTSALGKGSTFTLTFPLHKST